VRTRFGGSCWVSASSKVFIERLEAIGKDKRAIFNLTMQKQDAIIAMY
jgi:hypothetical protein